MAINLTMKSQILVFEKVLADSHPALLSSLKSAYEGGKLKVTLGMYSVLFEFPAKPDAGGVGINLCTSLTSLLKPGVSPEILATARDQLAELAEAALKFLEQNGIEYGSFANYGKQPEPDPANPLAGLEEEQKVAIPEPAIAAVKKALGKTLKKSQDAGGFKGTAVKLAEVTNICQPVRGSSEGSVYYSIAISPEVKIAARIKSDGNISLRAEPANSEFDPNVATKLKTIGMKPSGNGYMSVHFDSMGVPPARIIGAFLLGLDIEFTEQVTNLNQLKVE